MISTDHFYRSHICCFAQNDTKNMSFNNRDPDHSTTRDPDLYDHAKITLIHPVINAQWHAKIG